MIDLLVAADDRTGALETAGACAAAGLGPVTMVTTTSCAGGDRVVVVDMATRHVDAADAASRAAALERCPARRAGHKIDSLLRGNWAHELVARQRASGRRVLVVPASPTLGRTCRGGVVFDHGHAVANGPAGRDARGPVRSSRPAEHLRAAGAGSVELLASPGAAAAWAAGEGAAFGVADGQTTTELDGYAAVWASTADLLLAGPAAVLGAAAVSMASGTAAVASAAPPAPALAAPVLIVCGSLHAAARAQVDALERAGAVVRDALSMDEPRRVSLSGGERSLVLTTPPPAAVPVPAHEAERVAVALADACRRVLAEGGVRTLVLLGGDTAAAVLGDEPLAVGGTVAPGTPWARRHDGLVVVTRAGGFGTPHALVELLGAKLVP
jgi:uncharacterized protein YgbK (DUF1537 family)